MASRGDVLVVATAATEGFRTRGIVATSVLRHGNVHKIEAGRFADAILRHVQNNDDNNDGRVHEHCEQR